MLIRIARFCGLHMEFAALQTAENLLECSGLTRRTCSGRCCSMWESRLLSESITHHPNKMSQLGDSLCIAPTIGKGTPRTCEVNGAHHRTTEPMMLVDWCTVQQDTSRYGSLPCSGLCYTSGLATSRLIPSH